MIDEQKVLYKVKPDKIFAKEQIANSWTEAKELLQSAIEKCRKRNAWFEVVYDGKKKGVIPCCRCDSHREAKT